jgi:uncharacterized protein YjiK
MLVLMVIIVVLITISLTAGYKALWHTNSGLLANYRLQAGPIEIGSVRSETSGLAINQERDRIYSVSNEPPILFELDSEGQTLRTIPLPGYEDTEGISYVGDNQFAIVEERRGTLSLIRVDPASATVTEVLEQRPQVLFDFEHNRGLEGVTIGPSERELLLLRQRYPTRVYSVPLTGGNRLENRVAELFTVSKLPFLGLREGSGIHYDAESKHIFIVSARSQAVFEYTMTGEVVGRFWLKSGSAGLDASIDRAEGITMGADGTLYLCAEPNLLYIFRDKPN